MIFIRKASRIPDMSSPDQSPPPPQSTPQSEQDPFAVLPAAAEQASQGQVRYAPSTSTEDSVGMRLLMPVGRSGWAIAAGYLGLFALMIFPAPLAIIASILAIRDINKSKMTGKRKYGMGRAIFGLSIGILGTAVLLFFLFAWLTDGRGR